MGDRGFGGRLGEPDPTSDGRRYVSVIPDEAELIELGTARATQSHGWLLVVGVIAVAAAMVVGLAEIGVLSIGPRPHEPATIAELLASPTPSTDEASPSNGAPVMLAPTEPTPSPAIGQPVTAAPSPTSSPGPTPSPAPVIVIVVAGDSLSAIAAQHGAALADVLAANPQIGDPALIHVGDRITIPWAAVNQLVGGSHDVVPAYVAGTREACSAYGWAFDPNERMTDVTVRILVDGKLGRSVVANEYREDLAQYAIGGDGTAAFSVDLSSLLTPDVPHEVRVQARDLQTGEWVDLGGTPRELTCPATSAAPTPLADAHRFVGDFDLVDPANGWVIGHVVADLRPMTGTETAGSSLRVTWLPGSSLGEATSDAQLTTVWFADEATDPAAGTVRSAGASGRLCDAGDASGTSCQDFAVRFEEAAGGEGANHVAWSWPGRSECCPGPSYLTGPGRFLLT